MHGLDVGNDRRVVHRDDGHHYRVRLEGAYRVGGREGALGRARPFRRRGYVHLVVFEYVDDDVDEAVCVDEVLAVDVEEVEVEVEREVVDLALVQRHVGERLIEGRGSVLRDPYHRVQRVRVRAVHGLALERIGQGELDYLEVGLLLGVLREDEGPDEPVEEDVVREVGEHPQLVPRVVDVLDIVVVVERVGGVELDVQLRGRAVDEPRPVVHGLDAHGDVLVRREALRVPDPQAELVVPERVGLREELHERFRGAVVDDQVEGCVDALDIPPETRACRSRGASMSTG